MVSSMAADNKQPGVFAGWSRGAPSNGKVDTTQSIRSALSIPKALPVCHRRSGIVSRADTGERAAVIQKLQASPLEKRRRSNTAVLRVTTRWRIYQNADFRRSREERCCRIVDDSPAVAGAACSPEVAQLNAAFQPCRALFRHDKLYTYRVFGACCASAALCCRW